MIQEPAHTPALRTSPTGRREINPARFRVQSWWQGTTPAGRLTVPAGQNRPTTIIVSQEDFLSGDALFERFTADVLGPARVEFERVGGAAMKFMNQPVPILFLTGSADKPFFLPTPIYVPALTGLNLTVYSDTQSLDNKVRIVAHGQRFFARNEQELDALRVEQYDPRERPYWLMLDVANITLTAGESNNHQNMTVPSDGDFEANGVWISADGPCSIRIAKNLNGSPIGTGGGQNQVTLYFEHLSGGSYWYEFPADPAFFARQSVLDVQLDNGMSDVENNVQVCLTGRLLDYPRGDAGTAPTALPALVAPAPGRAPLAQDYQLVNGQQNAPMRAPSILDLFR